MTRPIMATFPITNTIHHDMDEYRQPSRDISNKFKLSNQIVISYFK